jgi:hypothetical protein
MEVVQPITISIDKLRFSPRNPRKMADGQYNNLIHNIQENGFNDPLLVDVGYYTGGKLVEDGTYEVVDGNHRLKACLYLGIKEVPCMVFANRLTATQREYMGIRYNTLHNAGFEEDMFTEIVNDLLKEYKTREKVIDLFMQDRDEFERFYKDVRQSLPDEIRDGMPKTAKEIKNIDDLAKVLNKMFAEYGSTLEHHYMILDYGGKTSLWIQLTDPQWNKLSAIVDIMNDKKLEANDLIEPEIILDMLYKRAQGDIQNGQLTGN